MGCSPLPIVTLAQPKPLSRLIKSATCCMQLQPGILSSSLLFLVGTLPIRALLLFARLA